MPSCIGPVVTPSHIAMELGVVSSILSSGGAKNESIHNIPLLFVIIFRLSSLLFHSTLASLWTCSLVGGIEHVPQTSTILTWLTQSLG